MQGEQNQPKNAGPQPAAPQQPAPAQNWTFKEQDTDYAQSAEPQYQGFQPITWSASEFIAHSKGAGWYMVLVAAAVVFSGVLFLLTKDYIMSGAILIVALLFGFTAARQPRELKYVIDEHGITVGEKFYPYSGFKSFSIVQEVGIESVWFAPLKRFMPSLSIYFDPKDGDKIINAISQVLPVEDKQLDLVDRLMHKIGF